VLFEKEVYGSSISQVAKIVTDPNDLIRIASAKQGQPHFAMRNPFGPG
jgi:hypothetical protein